VSTAVFRLGTRKSALALTQSTSIQNALRQVGVECVLVHVESEGDGNRSTPLYEIEAEAPGLFTKRLEQALVDKEIDLAVHSLKDLPTQQPPELVVGAVPMRAVSGDCLLFRAGELDPSLPWHLKKNAKLGTSSLRREAQWLSVRSDLEVQPLRGNVPTRIDKVRKGELDAVVLARAGLERLAVELEGLTCIALPEAKFVPAPGQGALAVELAVWASDVLRSAVARLHDEAAGIETRIERRILRTMEGGCTLPLGVRCWRDATGKNLKLNAFLGESRDRQGGKRDWKGFHYFDFSSPSEETLVAKTVDHFKDVAGGK